MMIKMMRNALLVNPPLRLPRACLGNASSLLSRNPKGKRRFAHLIMRGEGAAIVEARPDPPVLELYKARVLAAAVL
jgi:hypothetical protein